jgi:hypothetical protein
MASPDPGARRGPRKTSGLRDRSPAAWSMVLHAALLAAAAFVPWSQRPLGTPPRMEIVWVREWPAAVTAARPAEAPRPEPQRAEPPPTEPQQPESRQAEPQQAEPQQTESRTEPANTPRAAVAPSTEQAPNAPKAEQTPTPSTEQAPRASTPGRASGARSTGHAPAPRRGNIDWEAERRLAIQQLSREQERENRFPTFSFNDLVPKKPPEDADPLEHLFDGGGGGGGPPPGRSVNGVGQARTKVGRVLSNLCNALTGGVSVFGGAMSLCARDTTGPYSASPLRPEYLKKLPVCEEVPVAGSSIPAGQATVAAAATGAAAPLDPSSTRTGVENGGAGGAGGAGGGAALPPSSAPSTIKCRLLTEAERAEYWKNAAERLKRAEIESAPASSVPTDE